MNAEDFLENSAESFLADKGSADSFLGIEPEQAEPSFTEDFLKPTATALVKVPIHAITSMAQAPLSTLEAIPEWIDKGGNYIDVASRVMKERQKKIDEAWLTTPEERKSAELIGEYMAKPFELAGEAMYRGTKQAIPGLRYLPEDTILEPILKTTGQAGAMALLGKVWKPKPIPEKPVTALKIKTPDAGISLESAEAMVKGGMTGEPKFAGESSINLSKFDTTNDVKNFIDGLAKASNIEKKKVTWAETEKTAKELGWDVEETIRQAKKKGGFDTAEIYAMRQITKAASDELAATLKELPADASKRTDAIRLAALDKINNTVELMKTFHETASEQGRGLNIFKKMIQNDPNFLIDKRKAAVFEKMFDVNGGRTLTDQMLTELKNTDFSNPLSVREILQKYHKSTIKDKLFEAWLNGILSAPPSQLANIFGNSLTVLTKVPETAVSSILEGRMPIGEVGAEITGMFQGFKEGVRAGLKAFQTGIPSDMVSKIEHTRFTSIPGQTGKIIRIPTRALTAADEFFKAIVYRSEVNRLAYLKAIKEGGHLPTKMAEIINDPVKNIDIFNRAHEESLYRTFQKPLGELGNHIMSMRDKHWAFKFVIPFIKTPLNIAKFALERTPFNFGKILMDYKSGKLSPEMLSSELAKPIVGSMLSAVTTMYVLDGTITGGAPKDKMERDLLYATGWQPYSIKIGTKYYSYNRFEPIGSIMGLTADFVELAKNKDEKDINELANGVLRTMSKNLSSKTFVSGITKLLDAISGDTTYSGGFVEQLGGSVIPSGVAATARSTDPYVRDVTNPLEAIQSRIPGLSQKLPYKEGAYGEPVERKGGWLNLFSPVMVSEETDFKDTAQRDLELRTAKQLLNKEKRKAKKEISREKRLSE